MAQLSFEPFQDIQAFAFVSSESKHDEATDNRVDIHKTPLEALDGELGTEGHFDATKWWREAYGTERKSKVAPSEQYSRDLQGLVHNPFIAHHGEVVTVTLPSFVLRNIEFSPSYLNLGAKIRHLGVFESKEHECLRECCLTQGSHLIGIEKFEVNSWKFESVLNYIDLLLEEASEQIRYFTFVFIRSFDNHEISGFGMPSVQTHEHELSSIPTGAENISTPVINRRTLDSSQGSMENGTAAATVDNGTAAETVDNGTAAATVENNQTSLDNVPPPERAYFRTATVPPGPLGGSMDQGEYLFKSGDNNILESVDCGLVVASLDDEGLLKACGIPFLSHLVLLDGQDVAFWPSTKVEALLQENEQSFRCLTFMLPIERTLVVPPGQLGITIRTNPRIPDNGLFINSIVPNSYLSQQGVTTNSYITHVNGVDIRKLDFDSQIDSITAYHGGYPREIRITSTAPLANHDSISTALQGSSHSACIAASIRAPPLTWNELPEGAELRWVVCSAPKKLCTLLKPAYNIPEECGIKVAAYHSDDSPLLHCGVLPGSQLLNVNGEDVTANLFCQSLELIEELERGVSSNPNHLFVILCAVPSLENWTTFPDRYGHEATHTKSSLLAGLKSHSDQPDRTDWKFPRGCSIDERYVWSCNGRPVAASSPHEVTNIITDAPRLWLEVVAPLRVLYQGRVCRVLFPATQTDDLGLLTEPAATNRGMRITGFHRDVEEVMNTIKIPVGSHVLAINYHFVPLLAHETALGILRNTVKSSFYAVLTFISPLERTTMMAESEVESIKEGGSHDGSMQVSVRTTSFLPKANPVRTLSGGSNDDSIQEDERDGADDIGMEGGVGECNENGPEDKEELAQVVLTTSANLFARERVERSVLFFFNLAASAITEEERCNADYYDATANTAEVYEESTEVSLGLLLS